MKEGIKASELKSQFSDVLTYFFILRYLYYMQIMIAELRVLSIWF